MSVALVKKAIQQAKLPTDEPKIPRVRNKKVKKDTPLKDLDFLIDLADIDPADSVQKREKSRDCRSKPVSETIDGVRTAETMTHLEKMKIKKNEERVVKKLAKFMGHTRPTLPLKDLKTVLAEKRKRQMEKRKRKKEKERLFSVKCITLSNNFLS